MAPSELEKMLQQDFDLMGNPCQKARRFEGSAEWDKFWGELEGKRDDGCCLIYSLGDTSVSGGGKKGEGRRSRKKDFSRNVLLEKSLVRAAQIRINGSSKKRLDFNLKLGFRLKEKSRFGLKVMGILGEGDRLSIDLKDEQVAKESHFDLVCRFVCFPGSDLMVNTLGHVGSKTSGSSCGFDSKVLQIGSGGEVHGRPQLEVMNRDVLAKHGFSVGRVPQGAMTYFRSRGLSVDVAEKLYIRGFLMGKE
ncbi:SufD family Fe-S cluster assembly protein [Candidatus Dojkabacteria bacterium]|nr:SufD family Fe-S cluster assembly protein [Candidatus Dojkabacteria bacterium]